MKHATFLGFLRAQTNRDDPVGDFARDALVDPTFPGNTIPDSTIQSAADLSRYLQSANAINAAVRGGLIAYQEYLEEGV